MKRPAVACPGRRRRRRSAMWRTMSFPWQPAVSDDLAASGRLKAWFSFRLHAGAASGSVSGGRCAGGAFSGAGLAGPSDGAIGPSHVIPLVASTRSAALKPSASGAKMRKCSGAPIYGVPVARTPQIQVRAINNLLRSVRIGEETESTKVDPWVAAGWLPGDGFGLRHAHSPTL